MYAGQYYQQGAVPQPMPPQFAAANAAAARRPPGELAKNYIQVSAHDFRDAAIVALKSILGLLRIAKWMMDFWKGKRISGRPPGPTFSRVADERVLKSFYYVVDEAFSAPDHEDLRFLARNVVNQLLAATTVPTIVYALDEAAQLNARALHAFGGGELSLFTTPSTSLTDTPTQTAPATPMNTDGLDLDEVSKRLKTSARDKGKQRPPTQPVASSYFSFTIMQRPETLLVAWPVEFGGTFLEATAAIAHHLRECRREPSFVDFIAFHLGYHLSSFAQRPQIAGHIFSTPGHTWSGGDFMPVPPNAPNAPYWQ